MLTAESVCIDFMFSLFSAFSWNVPVIQLAKGSPLRRRVTLVLLHFLIPHL